MTNTSNTTDAKTGALPIISRVFDAPPERIFKAWSDPAQFQKWWGPEQFTNPVCELDFRVTGLYKVTMRSPDGHDFPMNGEYKEIEPARRIVMTADCTEHPPEWHQLVNDARGATGVIGEMSFIATFEDLGGGKTRLTVEGLFARKADYDGLMKVGMTDGWNGSFNRLENVIEVADPNS